MIEFGILTGKNIMSYGSGGFELDLSACKLTLIQGKNGASKSSIIEALTYCLFGKPYRNIKIGQLVNSINGKGLLTTLEFRSGIDRYKVVRGIKPNIFEIYKNDELIPEDSNGRDYQKMFEETILGFGYKTFKQVCVIGSASYVQFMSLSTPERRIMIEELLDVGVFSKMGKHLKSMLDTANKSFESLSSKILSKQGEIKRLNGILQQMQESETVKKKEYQDQIDNLREETDSIRGKIDSITEIIADLTDKISGKVELAGKYSDSKSTLSGLVRDIDAAKKTIKFFESNDHCSVCLQPITQDHKDSIFEKENATVKENLTVAKDLHSSIEDMKTKIDELETYSVGLSKANQKLQEFNSTIRHNESTIASLDKELKRDNDSSKVIREIGVVEKEIEGFDIEKFTIQTDLDYLNTCATMLKDTGIKSNVIATYIPIINESINKYLEMFDLFVNFELDENFDETIKSRYRDSFSYESFSEGEKSKINLSILFSWREIARMKNSVSCNLLFFDETLDSSLDADSIGTFLDVLKEQENSNVLVISHRGADPTYFDRCLMVEKKNDGFSVINELD
ncbi:MAG TPA: AAA family ATPase [Methanosarcina sp.]|nr:AAA family ATPase [Methanosarcina sp.]